MSHMMLRRVLPVFVFGTGKDLALCTDRDEKLASEHCDDCIGSGTREAIVLREALVLFQSGHAPK